MKQELVKRRNSRKEYIEGIAPKNRKIMEDNPYAMKVLMKIDKRIIKSYLSKLDFKDIKAITAESVVCF